METAIKIDNGKFYKTLIAVALPIALQNLVSGSFTMVDNIMVGSLGETALTGTGLATQIFFVHWMMIFGFCSGCSTFFSQFWGTEDLASIKKVLGIAWSVGFAASLSFFALAFFAPGRIMEIFTEEPTVIELGKDYVRIAAVNFLMVSLCQPVSSCLRATQQTKIPLYITVAAFFTNTALNYCLIFGNFGFPRMEIKGAALATVISRVVELGFTLYFLFGRKNPLSGKIAEYFSFDRKFFGRVIKNSAATTVNEVMWVAGMAAQNAAYGRMDVAAFAAYKAGGTIGEFFLITCFSVSGAALILIGERLGRGEYEYAKLLAAKLLKVGTAFSLFMGGLMLLCLTPLLSFFNLSAEGRIWARNIIFVIALSQPVNHHNAFQITGTMRSGGDTAFAAICEMGTMWFIRVPLTFLGALVFKLPIYLVFAAAELEGIIKAVILFLRYRSGKWIKNMIGGM